MLHGTDHAKSKARSRFGAFLSYSHSDSAKVRKLHSQLESYRLPQRVREMAQFGEARGEIGKVFRDRDDLSAAHSLSQAVIAALDGARVLVVLCSPAAKASPWVSKEIEYFRATHPERPILAAILSGEPQDVIPRAMIMQGEEPLAADLRAEGDGWKLGFLKIVAGIVDVPLDALIQRESQRQLRRVTMVTGALVLLALVMSIMTTIAIQSRNDAQQLRRNSDIFIDELLTDGREDLKQVGRLDILDNFNQRALRFFERQGDPSNLPADSLQNWATLFHQMGEDETNRSEGNLDAALEMFSAAHAATAELLNREPDNPDRIFAHAQSAYWIGRVDELRSDFGAASEHYGDYNALAVRLFEAEPGIHRSVLERGFGELNLGIVAFKTRELAQAGNQFDAAIDWFAQARTLAPDDGVTLEALANAHAWRFNVHFDQGSYAKALEQRMAGARIVASIAERDPRNMHAHFDVLIAERAIAITRCKLGERGEAERSLSALAGQAEDFARHDETNAIWLEIRDKIQADIVEMQNRGKCNAVHY